MCRALRTNPSEPEERQYCDDRSVANGINVKRQAKAGWKFALPERYLHRQRGVEVPACADAYDDEEEVDRVQHGQARKVVRTARLQPNLCVRARSK